MMELVDDSRGDGTERLEQLLDRYVRRTRFLFPGIGVFFVFQVRFELGVSLYSVERALNIFSITSRCEST